MEKPYKPELADIGLSDQADAINKYCLVTDTDTLKTIIDHLKTAYINDALFSEPPKDINDQFFRGTLNGFDVLYDFIHQRAEVERNPTLASR